MNCILPMIYLLKIVSEGMKQVNDVDKFNLQSITTIGPVIKNTGKDYRLLKINFY